MQALTDFITRNLPCNKQRALVEALAARSKESHDKLDAVMDELLEDNRQGVDTFARLVHRVYDKRREESGIATMDDHPRQAWASGDKERRK